jgi:hypothetical protein
VRVPRIKILDFGLAKLAEGNRADNAHADTASWDIVGTPKYMAPEQCRGRGAINTSADIYALGGILFEMTCGRPAFMEQGVGELILAHLTKPAPDPSLLNGATPPALARLISSMLAKDPAQRPDARQVAGELRGLLPESEAAPTPAPVSPGAFGDFAFPRRRARRLSLALALGGVAAAVVAWPRIRTRLARPAAPVAEAPLELDRGLVKVVAPAASLAESRPLELAPGPDAAAPGVASRAEPAPPPATTRPKRARRPTAKAQPPANGARYKLFDD